MHILPYCSLPCVVLPPDICTHLLWMICQLFDTFFNCIQFLRSNKAICIEKAALPSHRSVLSGRQKVLYIHVRAAMIPATSGRCTHCLVLPAPPRLTACTASFTCRLPSHRDAGRASCRAGAEDGDAGMRGPPCQPCACALDKMHLPRCVMAMHAGTALASAFSQHLNESGLRSPLAHRSALPRSVLLQKPCSCSCGSETLWG